MEVERTMNDSDKQDQNQENEGNEPDVFFQDAFTYMESLGIYKPEDEEANLQTVALINHNAFMAIGNWLLTLLEGIPVDAQEKMVARLGVFGQMLVQNINNQGTEEHQYILYIAHQTLEKELFEKIFALGLVVINYIDALVTKNNVDRESEEEYMTFYNECVTSLTKQIRSRLEDLEKLDELRNELDVDSFFNSIVFEITEQSKSRELGLF
jgi:hypothetical protein